MIAFASLLAVHATAAGIKVPPLAKGQESIHPLDKNKYPHWAVYVTLQQNRALPHWGAPYENALVVSKVAEKDIRSITYEQLVELGFQG